jgi:hypothetical protein
LDYFLIKTIYLSTESIPLDVMKNHADCRVLKIIVDSFKNEETVLLKLQIVLLY